VPRSHYHRPARYSSTPFITKQDRRRHYRPYNSAAISRRPLISDAGFIPSLIRLGLVVDKVSLAEFPVYLPDGVPVSLSKSFCLCSIVISLSSGRWSIGPFISGSSTPSQPSRYGSCHNSNLRPLPVHASTYRRRAHTCCTISWASV